MKNAERSSQAPKYKAVWPQGKDREAISILQFCSDFFFPALHFRLWNVSILGKFWDLGAVSLPPHSHTDDTSLLEAWPSLRAQVVS